MNFANRFGIAKRLHLVSLTVIAALLGLIFLAWMQLSEIGHLASEVSDNRAPQLERLTNVELSVTQVSLQLRHAMLVTTPADLASTLAYIGDKRKYIEQVLQELSKNAVSAEDRADAAKIIERGTGFWAVGEPNIALIQAGKKDEAFQFLLDKTIPARNKLLEAVGEARKHEMATLQQELALIQADSVAVRNEIVGLTLFIAASLLSFSWYIGNLLRRRVAGSQLVAQAWGSPPCRPA